MASSYLFESRSWYAVVSFSCCYVSSSETVESLKMEDMILLYKNLYDLLLFFVTQNTCGYNII